LEIIPGVYLINMLASNCYLITDPDGLTLIDAGIPSSFSQIVDFIGSLGRSVQELKTILLSHADIDHVGAAPALKAESGARIYASQIAAQALAEGHSSRQIELGILTPIFRWLEHLNGAMQIEVDELLSAGQMLPILGGLKVLETPGHTPGHLSFYAEKHKLLFAGDSVSTNPDEILGNKVKLFNWNQEQMLASVRFQAALQPKIVCSGHGPVVYEAASKFLSG
jgi:glyoxylase-like metal-dependent hydrolase (beta-lactamase superfamily II)